MVSQPRKTPTTMGTRQNAHQFSENNYSSFPEFDNSFYPLNQSITPLVYNPIPSLPFFPTIIFLFFFKLLPHLIVKYSCCVELPACILLRLATVIRSTVQVLPNMHHTAWCLGPPASVTASMMLRIVRL